MNPEERAKELVDKFIPMTRMFHQKNGWCDDISQAKQCAIICVNEIITMLEDFDRNNNAFYDMDAVLTYWDKVKESLQKLNQ